MSTLLMSTTIITLVIPVTEIGNQTCQQHQQSK